MSSTIMSRTLMAGAASRALLWLHRNPRLGWAFLFLYALAVTIPHEQVQAIAGKLATSIGRVNLYRTAGAIALALAIAVTTGFARRARTAGSGALLAAYWTTTLLLAIGTWAFLTANNTELVHYPQYFIPGLILMALTRSATESLCWIILAGGVDEWFQYTVLHGNWGIPYDFNDVFMNLLGGALGMLFALAHLRIGQASRQKVSAFLRRTLSKPGAALVLAGILFSAVLFASGKVLLYQDSGNHDYWFALSRLKPQPFWFFDPSWGPKTFHTLSPLEGPALLLLTIAGYAVLDWRLEVALPPEPEASA